MKVRLVVVTLVLPCLLPLSGCMSGSDTYNDQALGAEPDTLALSKQDIIDMSRARLGDNLIIKMIRTTDSYFRLRSRDVVALADSGVSDKVIEAMINIPRTTERRGARSYYPAYYPPYWWGPYPYYYPWSFGVSVGYYAPLYGRPYYAPHPYYRGGYYYGGGHSSGGGASPGGSRTSGQRR